MKQHITKYKTENGKTRKVTGPNAGNKNNAPDINAGAETAAQPDAQQGAPAKKKE